MKQAVGVFSVLDDRFDGAGQPIELPRSTSRLIGGASESSKTITRQHSAEQGREAPDVKTGSFSGPLNPQI